MVCACVGVILRLGAMVDGGVLPDDQPGVVQRDHVTTFVRPFCGHLEGNNKRTCVATNEKPLILWCVGVVTQLIAWHCIDFDRQPEWP